MKKQLKLTDLQKSYGKDLKKIKGNNNVKGSGIYVYKPNKDGLATSFVLNNNKVVEVDISYVSFTTSK